MDNSYIKETLLNLNYKLRDFGSFWRTNSVFRQGNNVTALQISKQDGSWYDFVLKKGGAFKDLVLLSKGQIDEEQLKNLKTEYKPEIKTQRIYDRILLYKLVKDFSYWENRKIPEEILKLFESGTCSEGIFHNPDRQGIERYTRERQSRLLWYADAYKATCRRLDTGCQAHRHPAVG